MKTIAVVVALVAVAVAAPQRDAQEDAQRDAQEVVVVKETLYDNIGTDGYKFDYQLSDGTSRDESAQIEIRGPEDAVLRVRGSYTYVGDDGVTYTVNYIADENGFQPQGAHIPVFPQA